MDVEAIAARIWPGAQARVELLGGGITNHNYRVDAARGIRSSCGLPAATPRCSGSTAPWSTRRRSRPLPSASGRR